MNNEQLAERERLIFLWKTQGGNMPWAKFAAMHNIPVHDTAWLEEALETAKKGQAQMKR